MKCSPRIVFLWVWQLLVQVIVSGSALPQQKTWGAWNHLDIFKSRVQVKIFCFPHAEKSSVVFLRNVMCFWPQFIFTFIDFGQFCNFANLTHFTMSFVCVLVCWFLFVCFIIALMLHKCLSYLYHKLQSCDQ